jgi:hypothetical protein
VRGQQPGDGVVGPAVDRTLLNVDRQLPVRADFDERALAAARLDLHDDGVDHLACGTHRRAVPEHVLVRGDSRPWRFQQPAKSAWPDFSTTPKFKGRARHGGGESAPAATVAGALLKPGREFCDSCLSVGFVASGVSRRLS